MTRRNKPTATLHVTREALPGLHLIGVLHDRVDLAGVVRAALEELQPTTVAVELPTTLAQAARDAVARLPRITAVISEAPDEDPLTWIVAPGDPIVEATRWAIENDRHLALVDPDIPYRGCHHDTVPDPHTLHALGAPAYLELVSRLAGAKAPDDADVLRERGMAHFIRKARNQTDGRLVAVLGAAHVRRVAKHLETATAPPLARVRRSRITLYHVLADSLSAVLHDPPIAHAVHESIRNGALPEDTGFDATVTRRVNVVTAGLHLISGDTAHDKERRRFSLVAHAAHRASRPGIDGRPVVDREALGDVLWRVASASYSEQTGEKTTPWQHRLMTDFSRRHARIQGLWIPGLFEWAVAARGVADDNLAWEVFDAATTYPWQEASAEIPVARIDGEMLDLGTRHIRFRRRFFRVKQRPVRIPVRRRKRPGDPTEWLEGFDADGLCSYPPEDIVIENFGRFVKQKAISIITAEKSRTEPFVSSLLDGVDLRETLSRVDDGRIWVRENGRAPGAAGAVVVIFDEDPEADAYPYVMTWLGEHDQESDMAFYATNPVDHLVGPGILRATYGAFMLTYPPGRLFDVWRDPDYRHARSKADVLTMAAIDYSDEKLVVHVAPTAPTAHIRAYAAAQAKSVAHVPIGSLSPPTLSRIRVVHILAGRSKREVAADYIW